MADSPAAPSRFRGTLTPLGIPDYRRLIASNTLWWQSLGMEMIVVGWLVLEMTDSAWQVALVGFYRMAPLMVIGFASGPIIDRFGRRRIILFNQVIILVLSGLIALLLWTGRLAFWHLAVSAVILGIAWAVDWPARRSFLPDLVGRAKTMDAMLIDSFTQNITRIMGPFASGVAIDLFGALGCYVALTGIAALSLLILRRISRPPVSHPPASLSSSWTRTVEGLRYVRRNQPIYGVLLITVVANCFTFPYMNLLPVFARDVLHQDAFGLGLLGAANGIGAFVGLFIVTRIRRSISNGWIFAGGSIFQAVALVGFAASSSFPLSFALLVLSGAGQAGFGVMQSSIVLLSATDDMRSRAMGTLVLAIGAGPPGRLQVGALAETFGAPLAVGLSAALSALLIACVAGVLPEFRRSTQAPGTDA